MGKIINAIGISVLAVGVAGGITAGVLGVYNFLMPEDYKVQEKRGSKIIYDKLGNVFVGSEPQNMLNYLIKEDPDRVRYAIERLEDRLVTHKEYSRYNGSYYDTKKHTFGSYVRE